MDITTSDVAPIPTSVFAQRYWRWLASAWPRENRRGRLRRPGLPTERRRDLICMATPRWQNPVGSQGARTPMHGDPRTARIQLTTRTASLSGDDSAPARPTLIHRYCATAAERIVPLESAQHR